MPREAEKSLESWIQQRLKGERLNSPPEGTLRQALALGSQLGQRETSSPRWWARLLFDSAAEPAPVGVRGTSAGHRRLLYQLHGTQNPGVAQLDLRVRREPGGTLELAGQLLPTWQDARVVLKAGRTRREQVLDETGEFMLRQLRLRGEAQLEISGEGETLIIPEIPLVAADPGQS